MLYYMKPKIVMLKKKIEEILPLYGQSSIRSLEKVVLFPDIPMWYFMSFSQLFNVGTDFLTNLKCFSPFGVGGGIHRGVT